MIGDGSILVPVSKYLFHIALSEAKLLVKPKIYSVGIIC